MKRRDRSEIIATTLGEAQCGAKKTNTLHRAYLPSYPQLTAYLSYLLEEEVVKYNSSSRSYEIAKKGLNFLGAYHEMHLMMNLEIDDLHLLKCHLHRWLHSAPMHGFWVVDLFQVLSHSSAIQHICSEIHHRYIIVYRAS
jgi:predicted transcriptional regulator